MNYSLLTPAEQKLCYLMSDIDHVMPMAIYIRETSLNGTPEKFREMLPEIKSLVTKNPCEMEPVIGRELTDIFLTM